MTSLSLSSRLFLLSLFVLLLSLEVLVSCGYKHDHSDDEYYVEPEPELSYVTCGSVIKLRHIPSGFRLHSHDVKYGGGSGQQSVTGYEKGDDSNSYWLLKEAQGEATCDQGSVLKHGSVFRLQHIQTGRNLHSHSQHPAPLSGNGYEVSCFGEGGNGDQGDNWIVEIQNKGEWKRGEEIRLKHQITGAYLYIDPSKVYPRPIQGQLEVKSLSAKKSDENAKWFTEEGVYFPANVKS